MEKRFQIQKYISKPDRKKLAERLGLKDSQVRTGICIFCLQKFAYKEEPKNNNEISYKLFINLQIICEKPSRNIRGDEKSFWVTEAPPSFTLYWSNHP